jgi:Family of unknown function (DUF6518)
MTGRIRQTCLMHPAEAKAAPIASPGGGNRAIARAAAAVAIGIAIGAVTSLAQTHLHEPWAALVNSASPWLLGGFAAGALQVRRGAAVAAGLGACVLEVAAYYLTSAARGFPVSHDYTAFWTVCAIVGGPLSGWAGWAWRNGAGRVRAIGAAFLPATFIAEGIGANELRLHYPSAAILFLIIGAILLALVAWPVRRLDTLVWTALMAVIGVAVYGPVLEAVLGASFAG